ncbi:MAG: hypothetical protein ACLFU4_07370 [Opitutales bacterium]
MENLIEAIHPGAVLIGAILLFLLLVVFKILKSLGKGILFLGALALSVLLVSKFAPGVLEPMIDFVQGGWLE